MTSENAQMKPSSRGHVGSGTTPQFSDNQPGGARTFAQEADRSRTHNASGTGRPSADGGAQQGSAQQTFARDARASGADARQYSEQPGVSDDANAGHRGADPGAGYYSHPFTHNYSYSPFGPPPFGPPPFGYSWPFPPPPYFGFPPFGATQGSVYPGMMPFGFPPFPDPSTQAVDPMRAAYPYAAMSGPWNMFRWLWSYITSWWMWIFSGFPRGVPPAQNSSPSVDAILRTAAAQADLMHQMLLKAAEVADHTRKACHAFAEQGGMAYAPFGLNAAFATPGWSAMARPGAPVDMEKLRQSLQTMDPVQAAQVVHAVQVVQAMDDARRRQQATGSFGW
jgi:hypothetical protein